MEKSIIDLFADSSNIAPGTQDKSNKEKKQDKSSSLKSSMMMEAMGLMSNPKKLKGIIMVVVTLLIIGIISTIAFFVIYPVCIAWAVGSYIVIAIGSRVIKITKDLREIPRC